MARKPESSNNVSEKFRIRFIQIIDDSDYTKKDFPEFVGVSKDVIIRATNYGIVPSLKILIRIADKVDISLPYLLGETDDNVFYRAGTPSSFHTRLKQLADEKGVKYSEISNTMPFAYNSIYEWIRTKGLPSYENLKPLAKYFNVPIDYLLGRTDERTL